MSDLGHIAILLALVLSLYSAVAWIIGERRSYPELVQSARNGVFAVAGLVTVASASLLYALLSHDFRLAYVASYSSREMHPAYLLSAFWGGNAGSLLFWTWMLSIFGVIVVVQSRQSNRALLPYVSAVIMVTTGFFLLLMAFISNPFERLSFTPANGNGLNPLLENPGMIFHPPTLLLGYAGFTVPFAFAIAALLTRRLGDEWVRSIRRWTLFAWVMLGMGNLLGAQWAYVELGWGGYWAWDPVENAGLMPWLVGTAFLHSIMIQRRRGMLKVWNMALIIIAFELSIFGTLLVRSGILSSVHSFAESGLGPFFMGFIGLTTAFSVALLYDRLPRLRGEDELDSWLSRESSFLFNNLILVGIAFATFWGTVFPLISEAVQGVKVTVSAPFFEQVNGPIFLALILLMGICPLIGWRRASRSNLIRNFLYPLVTALVVAVGLLALGVEQPFALLSFALCAFVIATILLEWLRGARGRHRTRGENYLSAFIHLIGANRPRYGGYIVHLAIIFIAIGVTGSSFFRVEKEVSLAPGASANINGYTLEYQGMTEYATADRQVTAATLKVYNSGELIDTMVAEKYFHRTHQQPVTEVAIRTTLLEDLYVILADWTEDGTTTFKVLINPLVVWIWVGGVILILGTVISFWPERRRASAVEASGGEGR